MELEPYLKQMIKYEASDLYLTTGAPPSARIHGELKAFTQTKLVPDEVKEVAYSIMDEEQIAEFENKPEMNLALSQPKVGRFRVNVFKQRNQIGMVIRHIQVNIPMPESLNLPPVLKQIIMSKRGLILFVGATGSGKSTSLASLIDYRNRNSSGHIITIEDPIEFIHPHKRCIVNQREVGMDTDCYEDALVNTLRQAPDVIMIGEIRNQATMEHALAFAETGHLAISTLHANNANQAFDRIINFFPEEKRNQALLDLSLNTCAIVSQRLIPGLEGKRIAAIEILTGTPLIKDLILRGQFNDLKEVMEKSGNSGMQTFDSALVKLHLSNQISAEEAVNNADSQNNVRLKISLADNGNVLSAFTEHTARYETDLEELVNTESIIEMAKKGEFHKIRNVAAQTFRRHPLANDDLLLELFKRHRVTLNDVMQNSDDTERSKQKLIQLQNTSHHKSLTLEPMGKKNAAK